MCDLDVMKRFTGEFVSTGVRVGVSNDDRNASWYPARGVKLTVTPVKMLSVKPGTENNMYAKIGIDPSGAPFEGKTAVEAAVYTPTRDGRLVARDIEVMAGLLVTETLTMTSETEMLH